MEIIDERQDGGNIRITDIEGDMGQNTRLNLLLQPDSDVVVSIYEIDEGGLKIPRPSIEFCTMSRNPIITKGLREIILKLAEENKKPGKK